MNIKVIIFAVIALLVGLGAGTGAVILTAPKHAASDSLHAAADSSKVLPKDAAHAELARALGTTGDSLAVVDHVETIMASGAEESRPGGTTPLHRVAASPGSSSSGHSSTTVAAGSASGKAAPLDNTPHVVGAGIAEPSLPNMTGIFINMKPIEAARILALLSDDQASDILRALEPRQAAGILCQLPPDRAAAVSRRMLLFRLSAGNK